MSTLEIVLIVIIAVFILCYIIAPEGILRGFEDGANAARPRRYNSYQRTLPQSTDILTNQLDDIFRRFGIDQIPLYATNQDGNELGQVLSTKAFVSLARNRPNTWFWLYMGNHEYLLCIKFDREGNFQVSHP